MRVSYVIVFVSDMKRSVAFYRDVLGIPLRFESPHWSEFSTDGATVALHLSGKAAVDAGGSVEFAGRCRPGMRVPDLNQFHRKMVENGVRCTQEPKEMFGARVAQYLDPDGLEISIGEDRRG